MPKPRTIWIMLVALVGLGGACGSGHHEGIDGLQVERSTVQRELSPAVPAADQQALVDGAGDFSLALYQRLAGAPGQGNLFFSPYSISLALSMTWAGAAGVTATEMADTLGFTLPPARHHPAFDWLDLELESRGAGAQGTDGQPFQLSITNALFGQQGYTYRPTFLDLLAQYYGAPLYLVDYMGDHEAARLTINAWVAQQTADLIPALLPDGSLDQWTRLVLANAIYFNAAWATQFREYRTGPEPFHRLDGSTVQVDMMHQEGSFPYVAEDGVQVIELPYDGDEVSMVVIVPDSGRYAEIEQSLDGSTLRGLLGLLATERVQLGMPRFTVDYGLNLVATLDQMGMPSAFSNAADFSGITDEDPLCITAVIHKAVVEVDETGTEAAAATAVVMGADASMPAPPDVILTLDRPYIFLIRDRATGALLFLGRVLDPS